MIFFFVHSKSNSPIIFIHDCITHENHWRMASGVTKTIIFHGKPYIVLYDTLPHEHGNESTEHMVYAALQPLRKIQWEKLNQHWSLDGWVALYFEPLYFRSPFHIQLLHHMIRFHLDFSEILIQWLLLLFEHIMMYSCGSKQEQSETTWYTLLPGLVDVLLLMVTISTGD